jgi:hypothetical protein
MTLFWNACRESTASLVDADGDGDPAVLVIGVVRDPRAGLSMDKPASCSTSSN